MRLFPSCGAALIFLTLAGCAAEVGSGEAPGSEEDELRSPSLTLAAGAGATLTVMDSPALKTGAAGTFTCSERVVLDGRERITCTRASELLEVIVNSADKRAVVVHRPVGRSSDQRTFFACTTSGNGPGALPATLHCTTKTPSTAGHGGLASPFASTLKGVGIPNAHAVGTSGLLIRAMAPQTTADYDDVVNAGASAVLVFKNPTGKNDLGDEVTAFTAHGLSASQVENIPFKWKDIGPFAEPCKQTVEALKFIATNLAAGNKTFFHCTVGEDRTGLLAATHRLLTEPSLTAEEAWDSEMCERGYGAGNPLKPVFVTGQLDAGLTPLYRKLAWLIKTGKLTTASLNVSVCSADPAKNASFASSAVPLARLKCGTSTRFEP